MSEYTVHSMANSGKRSQTATPENELHFCSFCGKTENEVLFLIPSPSGMYICDDCVEACADIINEQLACVETYDIFSNDSLPRPKEIKSILDDYVIGQDDAKKMLAVSVYNHYKRIIDREKKAHVINTAAMKRRKKTDVDVMSDEIDDVELQKSNVLMLGPTGVGKTYLAQILAKSFKVPFAIADATTLTEAGYVGEDVENILLRLIQAADYDIKLAEKGIIYIDEIDKISRRSENRSITRDVSGEGVQQALLKILEGTVANVPPQGGRKYPTQEFLHINTENILFICGGAFDGLSEIIEKRKGNNAIGFGGEVKSKTEKSTAIYTDVTPHDIIKFGLIPELVGRLPVIVTLENLNEDALVRIVREPKNSIYKQYQKLFRLDGVELEFEEGAFRAVAATAVKRETGARGLRAIIEELMMRLMYEIPSRDDVAKVIITADYVNGIADPTLVLKTADELPAANQ